MHVLRLAGLLPVAGACWLAAGTLALHAQSPSAAPLLWTWELGIDGMHAGRPKAPETVISRDAGALNPFLRSSDFGFGREFGGDARLRLRRDMLAFEARYFGGFDFDSSLSGNAPLDWFFTGAPGVPFGGPQLAFDAYYTSRLHSGEANARWHAHPQFVVFAGVRWLELKESFGVRNAGNDFFMQTRNRGTGPQVGFDWRVIAPGPAGGFFLDLDARLALLFADQNAAFRVAGGWNFTGSGGRDRSIQAVELGATIGWQANANAEWRIGYRALYLDHVALATTQTRAFSFTAGTVNVTHDDLWIHGVTFGFVLRQ